MERDGRDPPKASRIDHLECRPPFDHDPVSLASPRGARHVRLVIRDRQLPPDRGKLAVDVAEIELPVLRLTVDEARYEEADEDLRR